MLCDLVGSTALSGQLDPEDLRELILGYQHTVVGEITHFEGHIARFMGDGVLAYFGWPRAHEDEAERSVRAGLAVTAAVAKLSTPDGTTLAARVGIATGLVVVGDLIGEGAAQEEAAVGETPNLAARLQGLAEPGTVAISDATRRLCGELFELEAFGEQHLKGIARPVKVYSVRGARATKSRYRAHHAGKVLPLIGREHELALIMEHWQQINDGEGQMILLTGEAGIGKSRVLLAVGDALKGQPHYRINYQCSPYHTDSALYPVIQQLIRAGNFVATDNVEAKLDKLEALLGLALAEPRQIAPLIAALLGIDGEHRYGKLGLTPQQQRTRTLQALVGQFAGLAQQQPVLFLLEDAHWIDPTTLELIELSLEAVSQVQVMMLITARPVFEHRFDGHPTVTRLVLNRLGRKPCIAIIKRLSGNKALPEAVLDEIIAKTDGVPIFVEELTKTVLESGLLRVTDRAFVLDGLLPPLAIPASLHDSLLARLDRLGPIKEIAQLAACIGRKFDFPLIAAVADRSETDLLAALDRLASAELIFRRGTPLEARYTFKHALVQEAAYNSLLRAKRQQLHARIARELEQHFPETVEKEPELLAQHYSGAGLYQQAIAYWQKAGEYAVQRSANLEAVEHLTKGLDVIVHLPDESERTHRELALQAQLGQALIATKGYGAPETARCFERARELAEQVGDSPQLFPVLYGCWVYRVTWAEYPTARQMAERFLSLAKRRAETSAVLTGHRMLGFSLSCLGDFAGARENFEQVLALYQPRQHTLAFHYGQDPKAAGASMLAWNLWHLGYPDRAVQVCDEAVAYARDLNHTNTRGYVETFGAVRIQLFRRDREGVERYVNSVMALCEEQKLPFWVGFIKAFEGWTLIEQGRYQTAIDTIGEGLAAFDSTNTLMFKPHSYALLAQAYAGCHRTDDSLRLLDDALALADSTAEHWISAELHRLKGEVLLRTGGGANTTTAAESCFQQSLALARERSAKSWELRTATSLARLWHDQDKHREAVDLLAPVYGWFTEGFDTPDLQDAKSLLEKLSSS